ncbi:MAG: O-antigen ligase family protein [Bacillota bacterium]|nr:O-antigen ligase family protein [Bacillota bacterium]
MIINFLLLFFIFIGSIPLFIKRQELILYGLLIVEFGFGMYVGEGIHINRSFIMLRAVSEASLIFVFILNYLFRLSVNKNRIGIQKYTLLDISIVILFINSIALLIGLLYSNDINYIIGDYYKYSKGIVIVFMSWFVLDKKEKIDAFLQNSVFIYGIFISVYLYKFFFVLDRFRIFHTSVQESITFLLITAYLVIHNAENKKLKFLNTLVLFGTLLAIFVSQTRTFLILLAVSFISIILYSRKVKKIRRISSKFIILILLSPLLLNVTFINDLVTLNINRIQHTLSIGVNSSDFLAGGSRMGEILDVLSQFGEDPQNILFGFGLGQYVLDGIKGIYEHYMHNVTFEVLLRTGLIGLISYIIYYAKLFKISGKIFKEDKSYWWLSVVLLTQLINAQLFTQFWDSMPLYICLGIIISIYNIQYVQKSNNL